MSIPTNQVDPVRDTASLEERVSRNLLYNSPIAFQGQSRDLSAASENKTQEHLHIFVDRRPVARIPSSMSDTIATGTVSTFQPYLSQDHTNIYSELKFTPERIIKDANGIQQSTITILQGGGTIKFTDGRTESAGPAVGSNPIDIGKRYLLFLNFSASTHSYRVVKAWDLSSPTPVELSPNGQPMKSRNINDSYDVSSQDSLIAAVKEEVPK